MGISEATIGRTDTTISDVTGKVWNLYLLLWNDSVDFEQYLRQSERSFVQYEREEQRLEDMRFLLWLMIRRNGISREDIKAKRWALPLEDTGELFFGKDFGTISAAIAQVYIQSGVLAVPTAAKTDGGPEVPQGNPPMVGNVAAATPPVTGAG